MKVTLFVRESRAKSSISNADLPHSLQSTESQAFDNGVSGIRKWGSDAFYACPDPTLITHDWLEKVGKKYYMEKDLTGPETAILSSAQPGSI